MPTIAVRVPDGLTTKEAKRLLVDALKEGTEPLAGYFLKTTGEKLFVDAIQFAVLSRMGAQMGLKPPHAVAALLIAAQIAHQEKDKKSCLIKTLDQMIASGVIAYRQGQGEATSALRATLTRSGVILMEAPTGSGKTLAELCAAVDVIDENPQEVVVIAVPTISLMHQIEKEYALIQGVVPKAPPIGYVLGKNRFVSLIKFEEALEGLRESADDLKKIDQIAAAEAWMRTAKRSGTTLKDLPYQVDSLIKAVPGFPPCEVDSTTEKDDPGHLAYRAQFTKAHSVRILVVTHAMLGLDCRLKLIGAYQASKEDGQGMGDLKVRHSETLTGTKKDESFFSWLKKQHAESLTGGEEDTTFYNWLNDHLAETDSVGVLPAYGRLIVDEGHKLEQSFAMVMSDEISLKSVLNDKLLPKTTRKLIGPIYGRLVKMGESIEDNESVNIWECDEAMSAMISLKKELEKCREKSHAIKGAVSALKRIVDCKNRRGLVAEISFSPVYKYPRIRIGTTSVHNQLTFLWRNVQAGAVISATLMLPTREGLWSSSYIAGLLCIPKAARREISIHAADWLTSPVTVWQPEPVKLGERYWLNPPSMKKIKDRENYDKDTVLWIDELCSILAHVADTAAGGTLVLCSSYMLIEKISAILSDVYGNRLVVAKQGVPHEHQKQSFEAIYKRGARPIWLATGAAWTGLNMTDDSVDESNAFDDLMVTDLVVPRMPLRMNSSTTHDNRVKTFGWRIEVNEMLLLLKQGFGRLVRRPGIDNNRRIFFLDTRIYCRNYEGINAGVEKILSGYKKHTLKHGSFSINGLR